MTEYRLVDHVTPDGQVAVRIVDRPDRCNNLSGSGFGESEFGGSEVGSRRPTALGRRLHGGDPGRECAGVCGQPRVEITRNGLAIHVHDQVAVVGHS